MEKTIKLNLASGKDYRDGYINIDNGSMYDGKVDINADVFTLEYEENKVNEILVSHFMMYVDTFKAPVLLEKWNKWLKPNGLLIIETGDLKKLCNTILSTDNPDIINGTNGVMQMFGWANTKGHKWCWCLDTLKPLLENAGFTIIKVYDGGLHNRPGRDITIIAIKYAKHI